MINRFLEYYRVVKNSSEHTLRNYRIDLEDFQKFTSIEFDKIDKRVIRNYLASLQVSKRTILRRMAALRSFFKFLTKEKILTRNPMEEIESPKADKKIPVFLTYDQVMRLFEMPDLENYLGLRDRCLMELLYSSGLRVSEVAGLNYDDLDAGNCMVNVMGKGKKQRRVPITKNAVDWIKKYLNHPDREAVDLKAIFLNKFGKRITVRSIDRNFTQYLKMSGLSGKITPHTIRHTIATHWLEKGMDLKTIQVLLGHSSLATTTIYTQVSTKLKREVYDRAHPLAIKEE